MTKAMTEIIAATRLLIRGPILRHWMLAFTFVHARSAIIAIKTKLAKIPGIHVGSGPQSSRLYLTAAALAAATAAYRITRVSHVVATDSSSGAYSLANLSPGFLGSHVPASQPRRRQCIFIDELPLHLERTPVRTQGQLTTYSGKRSAASMLPIAYVGDTHAMASADDPVVSMGAESNESRIISYEGRLNFGMPRFAERIYHWTASHCAGIVAVTIFIVFAIAESPGEEGKAPTPWRGPSVAET